MVDEGLEKEIQKLADKDGAISKQVFMKYAFRAIYIKFLYDLQILCMIFIANVIF